MCGIAGFSGLYGSELLERMNASIAHRGPDGFGTLHIPEQNIGLTHRRLSIIDISDAGAQPMWDASHVACIVFNGEIYNFRELRARMEGSGIVYRGHSDTEVLINLYVKYGSEMLSMLNGIFAFAIWDSRTRELLIARDRLGVKPLYFTQTRKGLIFASEMKALFQCADVDKSIDPRALMAHMTLLWSPAPQTIASAVKKLEPGTALRVSDGHIKQQWRYYRLPIDQPRPTISEREAAELVKEALWTAVNRQMVSDVPIGAFLSGGLDSSSVVAAAHALQPGMPLPCFTIGFDDAAARMEGMTQDLPYAQKMAGLLGLDLHTVHVGPEIATQLPAMIYHLDEPQADFAPINVLLIAQMAREHGIKVLLSGAGGDDLFAGYRRHRAIELEKYWQWLPRSMKRTVTDTINSIPSRSSFVRRIRRGLETGAAEGDAKFVKYLHWINPLIARDVLDQNIKQNLDEDDLILASLNEISPSTDSLHRMLYLECRYFLPDHNLNYTDKMSMAAGVETRVPYLDNDLVDLAFRLPAELKQRGPTGKWILRKAMEEFLPREIINRPKTGFGTPLRSWLHGPLRGLVADALSQSAIRNRGLFDPVAVTQLIGMDRAGRIDASYSIFSILSIELWSRIFVDGQYPDTASSPRQQTEFPRTRIATQSIAAAKPSIDVTAIVLTKNEANNIAECLECMSRFKDICIVDSESTDNTVALAQAARADVRVFANRFKDFGDQRNWAIDNCDPKYEWIVFVDADEFCTPKLLDEIKEFVANPGPYVGGFIAGMNYFLGRWLKYSTMYPSYQLRLLKRGEVRYRKEGHGQREVTDGKSYYFKESWRHEGFNKGIYQWLDRHNQYSTEEIELILKHREEPVNTAELFSRDPVIRRRVLKQIGAIVPARPLLRFIYSYFIHLGFLDGYPGFIYCLLRAGHEINLLAKVAEMKHRRTKV
jgi:asparagine synthase (glutamine-hydrolysing)